MAPAAFPLPLSSATVFSKAADSGFIDTMSWIRYLRVCAGVGDGEEVEKLKGEKMGEGWTI